MLRKTRRRTPGRRRLPGETERPFGVGLAVRCFGVGTVHHVDPRRQVDHRLDAAEGRAPVRLRAQRGGNMDVFASRMRAAARSRVETATGIRRRASGDKGRARQTRWRR